MRLVAAIYSGTAYRECVLPETDNTDCEIYLEPEFTGGTREVRLRLEVLRGQWKLKTGFYGESDGAAEPAMDLTAGKLIRMRPEAAVELTLVLMERRADLRPMRKLSLAGQNALRVGRWEACDLCFPDRKTLSGVHGILRQKAGAWYIDCSSPNGIYINGRLCTHKAELSYGDRIQMAEITLVFLESWLAFPDSAGTAVSRLPEGIPEGDYLQERQSFSEEGREFYHRSPRMVEQPEWTPVEIEEPPKEPELPEGSWLAAAGPSLTMALPMLLGFGFMRMTAMGGRALYLYSGLVMTTTSAFLSVFWALTARRRTRQKIERQREKRNTAYMDYLTWKYRELESQEQQYRKLRLRTYPAAAEWLTEERRERLWERTPYHPDFLQYRLGLGTEASPVEIHVPREKFRMERDELTERPARLWEEYREIPSVPILLDGRESALYGLIGGSRREGALRLALLLASQMAACNCYTEVKMAFLYDGDNAQEKETFRFARWLPHVWEEESGCRMIAEEHSEVLEVLNLINEILRRRREQRESGIKKRPSPQIMVFLSEYRLLEQYPLAGSLLHAEPELGVALWILARREEELPHQCHHLLINREEFQGILELRAQGLRKREILLDHVTPEEAESFARSITGMRVKERRETGAIPSRVSFLELHKVTAPEELQVEERWLKNRTWQSIRGEIGSTSGGETVCLDLHEKYHGPHGLVAGTTGSGKSECLQTLLLSLAVNYSPEELAFFLIDYKGGGMAGLFEGLPHLLGSISNLSGGQTYRAMVSIKSENRRRQQLFLEAQVNNISEYTRKYRKGEAAVPVPHLLLVIDEFAELKREEPEFMQELISVAQVGRSLGVHLILATQKPAGVVDEHIRGNSRFRICLRVQDRQDSMDLLHHPDAAYLTSLGRGWLQVGNDEVYCEFQAGYSGAAYYGKTEAQGNSGAVLLTNTGQRIGRSRNPAENSGKKTTELQAVKRILRETAERMAIEPLPRLWMPELPERLPARACRKGAAEALQAAAGLLDDPENQRQVPLILSFPQCGSVGILGMAGSGKSTLLLTLLLELLMGSSPEQVELWGVDCSSGMLKFLESFPQVTGIWSEPEESALRRVFYHLEKERKRRKSLLTGTTHRRYVEQGGKDCPLLLVAVDNYSAFREKTEDHFEGTLTRLAKEGSSLGILLLLTGTGISMTEIPTKLFGFLKTMLCLSLGDRFAYGEALRTMQLPGITECGIPGRGLAVHEDRVLEFQAALPSEREDLAEALEESGRKLTQKYLHFYKKRLPEIPEHPSWEEFRKVLSAERKRWDGILPTGYEDCSAEPTGFSLTENYCCLLTGDRRTGRKNALRILLRSMLWKGGTVVILKKDPLDYPFAAAEKDVVILTGEEEMFSWFRDMLTPLFQERSRKRREWLQAGFSEERITEKMKQEIPFLLAIPDLSGFLELVRGSTHGIAPFLQNLLEKGRGHGIYFAAVMESGQKNELSMDPLFRRFSEARVGIRFGGALHRETVLTFEDLPYPEQAKGEPPGVGWMTAEGGRRESVKIWVPLDRREDL